MEKRKKKNEIYKEGFFTANEKGLGFITVEGEKEDFFVPEKYASRAFTGDFVRFVLYDAPYGPRKEAHIKEVLHHSVTEVVGEFERAGDFGFLICDDKRIPANIHIENGKTSDAKPGQKCVARIIDYGSESTPIEGEIIEILGDKSDSGIDVLSLVRGANVPVEFSRDALIEADALSDKLEKKELKKRKDLRDEFVFTIDGNDSKDFDDAVSIRKKGDDYILGVHIADVSYFVTEDSALDLDAFDRGNSIYLCDRVIPMLPSRLSDDLCSLLEGEDRLTLSCIMRFSPEGKLKETKIVQSVIRSRHRMTYDNVNLILSADDGGEMRKKYKDVLPHALLMAELSEKLRKRRIKRGSVEFDIPECEIVLDEKGHAIDVKKRNRGTAERMIEDFMLSANEAVAKYFTEKKLPIVYRVHKEPDRESVERLVSISKKRGISALKRKKSLTPKDVSAFLDEIKGRDDSAFLTELTLRSMQRAVYSTENIGHFGIASTCYCHFTSPIRRYSDLVTHRMINLYLTDRYKKKQKKAYLKALSNAAQHANDTERRADLLERAVDSMKMAEFMADHIGECFKGQVSGAIRRGVFVRLKNTVEGMVESHMMRDDNYEYDEGNMELVGKNFNRHYFIGQKVYVKCISADKRMGSIDFVFVDENGNEFSKRPEKQEGRKDIKRPKTEKGGHRGRKNRTKTYRKQ